MTIDSDMVAAQEFATWQNAANSYADNISPFTALSGQVPILVELGNISDGDSVLELGCGPGDICAQLVDIAGNLVGIDFADNMIEVARSRLPHIEFHTADAEKLPFSDDSFDVVISNYTAHHFARPQAVFKEARRVLKTGGRLAVIMPVQSQQVSFACVMSAIFEEIPQNEAPGGPLLNAEQPSELTSLIESAGFNSVTGKKREKPLVLASVDPVIAVGWDFMSLHDRPQDMQDRIRARTIENAKQYQQAEGTFLFPDKVLVASGIA